MLGAKDMGMLGASGGGSPPFIPDEINKERFDEAFGGPPAREWHSMGNLEKKKLGYPPSFNKCLLVEVLSRGPGDLTHEKVHSLLCEILNANYPLSSDQTVNLQGKVDLLPDEGAFAKEKDEFYLGYILSQKEKAHEATEMQDMHTLPSILSPPSIAAMITRVLDSTTVDECEEDLNFLVRVGANLTRREIDIVWEKLEAEEGERYEQLRDEFCLNYVLGTSCPSLFD